MQTQNNKRRIVMAVEYDGSEFYGWQRQSHFPSVQEVLEKALSFIANHQVTVFCAGRTDRGVHALNQIIHFDTLSKRTSYSWIQGTNTRLPPSVAIKWAQEIDPQFDARFKAHSRHYRYWLLSSMQRPGLMHNRVGWTYYQLDHERMKQALSYLLGEHDFSSFRAASCQAKSPIRTIRLAELRTYGNLLAIDIIANSFLHHMVRNIVGCLIMIARGERNVDWLSELIIIRNRHQAAATIESAGLYFIHSYYDKRWLLPMTLPHSLPPLMFPN